MPHVRADVANADDVPCEFTGEQSANTWWWWVEEGVRHWYKGGLAGKN